MSSITFNHIQESGRIALRALPEIVIRLGGSIGRYFNLSRAERELAELDDRLLADIGVRRGEIHAVVWGGRRFR